MESARNGSKAKGLQSFQAADAVRLSSHSGLSRTSRMGFTAGGTRLAAAAVLAALVWLGSVGAGSATVRAGQDEAPAAAEHPAAPVESPAVEGPSKPKLLKHIIESAGPVFGPLL